MRRDEPADRLQPLSQAWLATLESGRDPDGLYTLAPGMLPLLRRLELADQRRQKLRWSYESARLDSVYWDYVEMTMEPPEELVLQRRRAARVLRQCSGAIERLEALLRNP